MSQPMGKLERGEINVSANGKAGSGIWDPLKRCYQIVQLRDHYSKYNT